jgi:hypothetical protein
VSDRRLTPANDRVVAAHLPDADPELARVTPAPRQVAQPVVDLMRSPGGPRDRQVIWGEHVGLLDTRDGWSFVQAEKDGYVGYLRAETLADVRDCTHWVSAPATHVYAAPDIKSPDRHALSFGSRIAGLSDDGEFVEIAEGFVPRRHLLPDGVHLGDPVAVAALFLGTPYLWGGNSRTGIDCSGLVQAALVACGHPCPGDSDLQQQALGRDVTGDAMQRGDLLFWPGHVALVDSPDRILHANAHSMSVAYEPMQDALERIAAETPLSAHKRLG